MSQIGNKFLARFGLSTGIATLDSGGKVPSTQIDSGSVSSAITGGASTIVSSDLTASRTLVSDGSGKVAISAVTSTTLAFLDATSSVQTQLNAKAATSLNNLASVSFNSDLIPSTSSINVGSTSIPTGHMYSQNFMNPVASSNLTVNTATISSGAAASGILTLQTGSIDTGTSGNLNINTGGSAGATGNSGSITISTGNASGATSGTSGNINLTVGNATTTNGSIIMTGGYLRLPRLANDPTGVTGAIYYNTGSNTIRWYNGTIWAALA